MDKYLEILSSGGPIMYILVALVFLIFAGGSIWALNKSKSSVEKQINSENRRSKQVVKNEDNVGEPEEKEGITLEQYKAMCFRPGNILEFLSTLKEAIGEVYQFDGSLLVSGSAYIVLEENKKIVDCDPRDEEFKLKQSPEYLWLATHPQTITRQFWSAPVQWWRSTSTWFAAAMIAVTFICALVVFD